MRVELTADIFADADDHTDRYDPHDLYELLRCFHDDRHEWVTSIEVVDAVRAYLPGKLPDLADTYADLAEDAMVKALAWTGTSQQRDVVRVGRSDLADHSADLRRPAVVVVENSGSDRAFLTTVAHVFRHQRILIALEKDWLEVHSAGGSGEVPKVAREHAGRYRRLVRVVAVFDSDRLVPNQRTGNHDSADKLTELNVAVHVLMRREAENYVPNRVLARIGRQGEASRKVGLVKRLTPRQRAYVDMKYGFGKVKEKEAETQRELYADLDPAVRHGLRDGFGKDLLEQFAKHREHLTERDFADLGDDVVTELRALLDLIASRV